ncbi:tetratricopeptide repeat protein [Pontibacter toksunensis]|uniref:Tetratricopeptide repeat protein n=1 Tax=Pontibacter toksunensis TaxID=1332631 RepID=A0ABW6BS65_9BACT
MKVVFFLLFLLIFFQTIAQQSNVVGVVSIFNSETRTGKRQYVANAQVEDNNDRATPTVTNSNGQFRLIYVGIPEKEPVSFQIKKSGLEIVNHDALSAIAGQNELVRIAMAHPDSISEYRRSIYRIGKTQAEKRLEKLIQSKSKQLAELKKNDLQKNEKIKLIEEELLKLEDQRMKIEEQIQELSRRYAPVNLDDASPLFRDAFLLFQKGSLDSAMTILNNADLEKKVNLILQEREKSTALQKELLVRDSLQRQRTEDTGGALKLKADLHTTRYEVDSATSSYELLIKLDSSNPEYFFYYGTFLSWLNQLDKAINYLEISSRLSKTNSQVDESNIALIQYNLGNLYMDKNEYNKAEAAYLEAFKMYRRFAQDYPQIFEPDIAKLQNSLALLYTSKREYRKAETTFLQALGTYQSLAKAEPKKYESGIAVILDNLGSLYQSKREYVKAEKAHLEALEKFRKLSNEEPQTYEPEVARVQVNLGSLYGIKEDLIKTEAAYIEAFNIYSRLFEVNPKTFEPRLAETQNNLGILYHAKNEFIKAEKTFLQALDIYNSLAKADPQTYELNIATVYHNLGNLHRNKKEYTKAEEVYLEAFHLRDKWAKIYPKIYAPVVSLTAINLLKLYSETLDSLNIETGKSALEKKLNSIDKYINALSENDADVLRQYCEYVETRSWQLLLAFKFKEAEVLIIKCLNKDLSQIWLRINLAHSLLFQNRYRQALDIYRHLKPFQYADGKRFATVCLEDLDELEKRGAVSKDINKVREFLKK